MPLHPIKVDLPPEQTFVRLKDPERPFLGSLFDDSMAFERWHAVIRLKGKMAGGTPGDPEILYKWLMMRLDTNADDRHLHDQFVLALQSVGHSIDPDAVKNMSTAQIIEMMKKIATSQHTVVFRRDPTYGLYIETRCIKAMIKEAASVAFSTFRTMFPNGKGAKSFFAENVFVVGDAAFFGAELPDDVQLFVGHVRGPKGPQANLTYYEVMFNPIIEFDVLIAKPEIVTPLMPMVLKHAEYLGLGALRSQQYGQFAVPYWERHAEAIYPEYLRQAISYQKATATREAKGKKAKAPVTGPGADAAIAEAALVEQGQMIDGTPVDEADED